MHHLPFLLYSLQCSFLYSSLIFCCDATTPAAAAAATSAGENNNKIIQHEHLTNDTDNSNGTARPRPRPMVFGLGPGRTGTDSLREALIQLGFGPTYHMKEILLEQEGISTEGHLEFFHKAARATQEHKDKGYDRDHAHDPVDFRHILKEYNSGVDWPLSAFPDELLAAFPDAKFILTKRSAKGWHKSIQSSVCKLNPNRSYPMKFLQCLRILGTPFSRFAGHGDMMDAIIKYKFAPGLASTWPELCNSQQIAIDALEQWNERVERIIPPHQLLIFELGVHGYRELNQFLNDMKDPSTTSASTSTSYPRVNSTKEVQILILLLWLLCILLHVLMIGIPAALMYFFLNNHRKKKDIVSNRASQISSKKKD